MYAIQQLHLTQRVYNIILKVESLRHYINVINTYCILTYYIILFFIVILNTFY